MRLAHPPLKDYKGLITPSGPITTLPELDDWILEVTREHQIRDGCGRWLAIGADCSLPGRVGSSPKPYCAGPACDSTALKVRARYLALAMLLSPETRDTQ